MADIAILGMGRMGRGIAQAYALAGQSVWIVDAKQRGDDALDRLVSQAREEIANDLRFLASIGVGSEAELSRTIERIQFAGRTAGEALIGAVPILFEGVPETLEAKQSLFAWACRHISPDAVIASTSSTMAVDDLAAMGTHPERFVNAHWLNPAVLMPLVEVARGKASSETSVARLVASLEAIGKSPVVMRSSPGYIVPRIQALAMNEAARLAEEGVASVEEIDRAIRLGFGIRYAVLGMIEFIDFGGNDILFYASDHLSKTVDDQRYQAPRSVVENMQSGHNGMREGKGFYDWSNVDTAQYRSERLGALVQLLKALNLAPKAGAD